MEILKLVLLLKVKICCKEVIKIKNKIIIALICSVVVIILGYVLVNNENNNYIEIEDEINAEGGDNYIVEVNSEYIFNDEEMFTNKDLKQVIDLNEAEYIKLESESDININLEGVYVLSGEVNNCTVIVEVDDESKVQIVLDGVNITNESYPAIYIKSGDKVFITTTDTDNYMEVSDRYIYDGDTNLDAVIFSKSDLVLNGIGNLEIISNTCNGVTAKDDLKVTGGTYIIESYLNGLEANDSIRIYDGNITITSKKDAIHCENDEDASLGYIYIVNGTLNINAIDDAIMGNSIVQIEGGDINIETCSEGIESTYIEINGGDIDIYATDDGINATNKTNNDVKIQVKGGDINIVMGQGDTDGFDSNGDIYINGGIINIDATSAFDSDGEAILNNGDVTVNGEKITEIVQTQMKKRF